MLESFSEWLWPDTWQQLISLTLLYLAGMWTVVGLLVVGVERLYDCWHGLDEPEPEEVPVAFEQRSQYP